MCEVGPGVAAWPLLDDWFAELAPKDFRGAAAATAVNKNRNTTIMRIYNTNIRETCGRSGWCKGKRESRVEFGFKGQKVQRRCRQEGYQSKAYADFFM